MTRHPRAPRPRPDRATLIALILFVVCAVGIILAFAYARDDAISCFAPHGNRWC